LIAMPIPCPFCLQENVAGALVCASCARDIAVPASLLAERDELCRKRDAAREELSRAKRELEELKRGKQFRLVP
jgi:hypothetical protein